MNMKILFLEKIEHLIAEDNNFKILDLGCGQSKNFLPLFEKYPNLNYLGIEPISRDATLAAEILKKYPNAKIINQLAYDKPKGYESEQFDLCFSLSVLEHVKKLDIFLLNSINMVRSGGQLIHFYDLGHSLHPSSFKEKFQIFLGNSLPWILPELKFAAYVDQNKVKSYLENNGVTVEKITYHQMPSHKEFAKSFTVDTDAKKEILKKIFDWEFEVSKYLSEIEQLRREWLFPSVCIWARKN